LGYLEDIPYQQYAICLIHLHNLPQLFIILDWLVSPLLCIRLIGLYLGIALLRSVPSFLCVSAILRFKPVVGMSFVFYCGNAKETHWLVDQVSESREGLQAINTFDKLHLCWRWIFLFLFAGSNEATTSSPTHLF